MSAARRQAKRRTKRLWVCSWLAQREEEYVYHRLVHELRLQDEETEELGTDK